jgi:hypothetical protein
MWSNIPEHLIRQHYCENLISCKLLSVNYSLYVWHSDDLIGEHAAIKVQIKTVLHTAQKIYEQRWW